MRWASTAFVLGAIFAAGVGVGRWTARAKRGGGERFDEHACAAAAAAPAATPAPAVNEVYLASSIAARLEPVVRDAVAGSVRARRTPPSPDDGAAGPPPDEAAAGAFSAAQQVVATALQRAAWTVSDGRELRAIIGPLSTEQRSEIALQLMKAINLRKLLVDRGAFLP